MAWLYFDETLEEDRFRIGESLSLSGPDAHHAVSVARLRSGEAIAIGDGCGRVARGRALSVSSDAVSIEVLDVSYDPEPNPRIRLVQALAKGDRSEMAVQMATELGVDEIVPWMASRSVVRWDAAKASRGRHRWQTIAREAAKQSMRTRVPVVTEMVTSPDASIPNGSVFLLDPDAVIPITGAPIATEGTITVIVGPEGGVAAEEFEAMALAGALRVRLGSEVLRTSSAGPAAIVALLIRLGRW